MGTQLYGKGAFLNKAFEELNVSHPELVKQAHAEYVEAGAVVLETNTFAANRFALSPHGLADRVTEINAAGVAIAREAAGNRAWVTGAIGPLGARIEPYGPIGVEEVDAIFREQAQALADAGVDGFVLETFTHLPELVLAVRAVRAISDKPIVAQVSVVTGGQTREGVAADDVPEQLVAAGADAVGVNCSDALSALDALAAMRETSKVPLAGQPNAGQPRSVDGRNIYLASPEYLVAWGRRALRNGATLLGGCCGTTPDHIRALRTILTDAETLTPARRMARRADRPPKAAPVPKAAKSRIARAFVEKRFVTGVEVPAPSGWQAHDILATAHMLAKAGVDFLSLPEGARHGATLPPVAVSQLCWSVEGLDTIVFYSCRARQLHRIQSDLLGAHATGTRNLVLVTGDPSSAGADATPDLDIDSIGAVNLVNALNHGEDAGGGPIGKPTAFHIGVRLDPVTYDLNRELGRLNWKIQAGADYAITSPVFDPEALQRILAQLPDPELPVIATVWPMQSAREAEFFEQEMANVPVPEPLIERMREAEKHGNERETGIAIARELAAAIKPLVAGLQVVAPDGDADAALAVLAGL